MAEKKDYINLSVEELEEFIKQEFKDSLYSYPISMMEARAGIYLDVLDDGSLYLDTLNIRPDLQGKGVGSEILGILKEWAIANGKAVYIKPAYLSDNPFFKGVELSPEKQVDSLFNFYKKNGWEDNPNFTALSEQEQAAQLSLSANREWGVETNDIYSPLVFIPEGVEVPELPKNPYLDSMISFAEKFNREGKTFLDGYNEPILDEVLEEVLKLEMYFGVSGFMEESEWEKSKLHDVAIELDSQGIHPNDVADISEYIPRDKILTPAEIFKEGKRNEFFTDGIVKLLSEAGGSFYNLDENGDELFPENKPKRDYELYYAISGKDEAENLERVSAYKKKHNSVMGGPPKSLKWIEYSSNGERPIPGIDTPTSVVDDIPDNIQKLIDEGKVIETKTGNSTFKTLNRDTLLIDDINISTKTYQELMDFADKNNYTLVVALERITEDSGLVTSEPGPMNKDELYKFWTRNGNEYFNWDLTYDNKKGIEKLWNDDRYVLEFYEPNQQAVKKFQDEIQNKYPELEQNRKAFRLEMYPYKTYDTNGNPVLMLREINVKPEFQGKGIGTQIMNELIEFADNLNIPILLSTSPEGRETLPEFYNRFGFLETGETGSNFQNEKFMIRQPNELAGKVGRIGEVGGTEYKSYEEALEAVKNIDTPTNVVDDGRLLWGSEEFINTILDDMRASADLFEFDMEGDLEAIRKSQPEIAKQIEQGKINIANHVDAIDLMKETLDRTDLPPGMSKAEASDTLLMLIEAAQSKHRETNPDIPILGITDTQSQDPEFKKILTQQFADTPTNVVDAADEFPSLETRFKTETIDPDDYASPGDKYDLVTGWEDDVITPNKVFNPDQFTIINEQGLPVFAPQGKEMYQRILSGTATDEDITKFFIYLVTHSPAPAYTFAPFNKPDALADIIKIGIFSDRPLNKIIPLGSGLLEKQFFDKLLSRNKNIKPEEIVPIILDIVQENGQFENIRDKMRNVILNAHNDIYNKNPNDYFVLWRGGDLNRTFPWQSMTKRMEAAQDVASQMNGLYGSGIETSSYVLHKNNFIDLDALGLSYMNEQEIIVFTEAALAKGAKRPTPVNNPGKAKDITEWWLIAKESKDMFPKNGVDMTNISQYVDDSGQATQQFFSDVINGIDPRYRPSRPYESIIEITNEQLLAFQKEYNYTVKSGGNFNQHIFTSIPTFYEAQIVKGQALINYLNNNYPTKLFSIEQNIRDELFDFKLLDIGGTEGSWASAVAGIEPRIQVTVLDPNRDAERIFNKRPLVNKKFQLAAFSHKKEDFGKYFDETAVSFIKPKREYDIVHESMALQFIDGDRTGQIEFIKNEVLKEDGILFIEEKFLDNDTIYQANENLKNEFKLQYYTEEQLQNKKFNVLLNMEGKQAAISDVEATLNKNFKHVVQYWDSGNFKGFVASDDEKVLGFVDEINALNTSLTNHRFSTAPTDKEVKYSIQKKMAQNGTDPQLAAQIAEETMSNNPKFFNAVSKQVGKLTGAGLGLLAKVTPALAPGDVIIERALDKVVPYLDDAAAKLGFGRLKFGQIIPAYAAYEIGVALADTVQAALYAYDTSQQQAPREAGKFQQGLTKLLLPKAYEEQALKKSRLPGDLKAFYNTPTGKAVLEELDFGSQFMKELEAEKISKYSPGWGLTKSIFSLIGSAYEGSKNPSDYSTKLKDNPAMIYNAGFTGNNR